MLTNRDKQYLRAIFLLKGSSCPIGPKKLAIKMGVSKVCAFQKMRRLEALGLGEYHLRKGLQLNDMGVGLITHEIKKHHVLEKFLEDTLKMNSHEACDHSTNIGPFVGDKLMNNIANTIGAEIACSCGSCFDTLANPSELEHCHWLKKGV